jgi:hypothetical protein
MLAKGNERGQLVVHFDAESTRWALRHCRDRGGRVLVEPVSSAREPQSAAAVAGGCSSACEFTPPFSRRSTNGGQNRTATRFHGPRPSVSWPGSPCYSVAPGRLGMIVRILTRVESRRGGTPRACGLWGISWMLRFAKVWQEFPHQCACVRGLRPRGFDPVVRVWLRLGKFHHRPGCGRKCRRAPGMRYAPTGNGRVAGTVTERPSSAIALPLHPGATSLRFGPGRLVDLKVKRLKITEAGDRALG